MTTSLATAAGRLAAATERVAEWAGNSASELSGGALVTALRDAAEARNAAELLSATPSAEIARRSTREQGYEGLAQKLGHRTVTSLVQIITGQTRADVGRTLRTGEELAAIGPDQPVVGEDVAVTPPVDPGRWLALLREALIAGRLSQAQFQALRVGLGSRRWSAPSNSSTTR